MGTLQQANYNASSFGLESLGAFTLCDEDGRTKSQKTHKKAITAGGSEGVGGCICKPNPLPLDFDSGLPHSDSVKCNAARHNTRAIIYQEASLVRILHTVCMMDNTKCCSRAWELHEARLPGM